MRLALSLFLKMSVTLRIIQGYLFSVLYIRKKKKCLTSNWMPPALAKSVLSGEKGGRERSSHSVWDPRK